MSVPEHLSIAGGPPSTGGAAPRRPPSTPVCLAVPWPLKGRSVHAAEVRLPPYSRRPVWVGLFSSGRLNLPLRVNVLFVSVTSLLSLFFLCSFRSASSWNFRLFARVLVSLILRVHSACVFSFQILEHFLMFEPLGILLGQS